MQGTSIKGITKDELLAKSIMVPQYAEQRQIGAFFKQLDHLITLHQRKCANLCSPSQVVFSLLFATSTFSWEQRKLGEIGSVSMCRRIFKEQTSETGDIPFYKIGTFGADPDAFISRELFEEYKSKYPYPQKGDILISASGSIGRTVEFAGNNEYFQDSNIVWLNHDERLSNPFLKCFYSVVKWAGIEGSTIKRLYNDNILNTVICMPSVPEQKRIGLFFENLDNLITLHQRECISFTARAGRLILTANKKRNTSSWEQRKVQGVADRFDNLRIPVAANLRVHGTTPYYGANGIQDYVEGFTHDGEFVLVAEDGANDLKNYPVKCVNGRIWVNNHAHVLQGKAGIADNSFLAFAISQSDIESLLVGGGRAKLNAETLMSIEFRLPCLQEQYRIGEYLTQLNHLITLHQRKPFLMKWRTSDANRNQTNRLVL